MITLFISVQRFNYMSWIVIVPLQWRSRMTENVSTRCSTLKRELAIQLSFHHRRLKQTDHCTALVQSTASLLKHFLQ